jgi:hypothetical protein
MKSAGILVVGLSLVAGCDLGDDTPPNVGWGGDSPPPPGFTTATTSSTTTASVTVGTSSSVTGGVITSDAGTYDRPVIVASSPPPPVSGGTLTVIAAGHRAAVADPDRDQVAIVDLDALTVSATIPLEKRDEPGRIVEDAAGNVHVVLRGSGAIAALDPVAGVVLGRRPVCAHPRGLAYDAKADVLHVACAGGELVTFPASGDAIRQLKLDRDLRDVVIDGDRLLVSRFRTAELLVVEADGHVSARMKPQMLPSLDGGANGFTPAVAWRTIPAPGGGAIMVHEEEQVGEIVIQPGGYGGGCGGIVKGVVSLFQVGAPVQTSGALMTTLPVDVAIAGDVGRVAVAGAGVLPSAGIPTRTSAVVRLDLPAFGPVKPPPLDSGIADASGAVDSGIDDASGTVDAGSIVEGGTFRDAFGPPPGCSFGGSPEKISDGTMPNFGSTNLGWQAVAVAFDPSGRLLVQTRQPALVVASQSTSSVVKLPGNPMPDTGHELFHLGTIAGVSCASCHPEGHEDGHTWSFAGLGARRTQDIGGGILGTEPFHWDGDMGTFTILAHQVFNSRMSGPNLQDGHITALANWINALPAWKPTLPADAASAERGRVLFHDPRFNCATCHAGAKMTNNATVDVGTGRKIQVPSLIGLGFRSPYLHNGCAVTIDDRFGLCGGGDTHGMTSALTAGERADLVAYLGTL